MFDGLLAKLCQRLFHWSSKLLTMGGKIVLIRHVLTSIPLHLLQALQPPKAVLWLWAEFATVFCGTTPSWKKGCIGQLGKKFVSR